VIISLGRLGPLVVSGFLDVGAEDVVALVGCEAVEEDIVV
jgi:hypothetical protein